MKQRKKYKTISSRQGSNKYTINFLKKLTFLFSVRLKLVNSIETGQSEKTDKEVFTQTYGLLM